jgi:amidase
MASLSSGLHFIEIADLATLIEKRDISSVEVTRSQLGRIELIDRSLHSYAWVMAETALAEAEAADAEIGAGKYRGPLHGVPLAVKDLCWTAGYPTAAGMAIYRDFRPNDDATVVHRLREAGGVILGKLQLTEGAYSDHHPEITPPRNPWNPAYWPGISSSGAGAALAAGLCFGALGSDTGGSIRWPSAANGVTGLKPSWGRVSRYGVIELAATLDHVGTMARSVADAGLLLKAIAGIDPKDPTALQAPAPNLRTRNEVKGLRIGIDPAWNGRDVATEIQATLSAATTVFHELGAEITEVALPDPAQMIADWASNCAVEAAVAHEASYRTVAVANPLRSVANDARTVSDVLAGIAGPVVLVGHSYGGQVISNAARGHATVKSLVYVAAFAPDAGEAAAELAGKFPGGTLGEALAPPVKLADGGVDLYIDQAKFHDQFAHDVPATQAAVMAAGQRPITEAALTEKSGEPAWKSLPSYFVYGDGDKNIPAKALGFMAERAGSKRTVVAKGASHVVMVSQPQVVAELIKEAAK